MRHNGETPSPDADGFIYTDVTYDTTDKFVWPRDTHHVDT